MDFKSSPGSERLLYLTVSLPQMGPKQSTPQYHPPANVLMTREVKSINHSGNHSSCCDASSTATTNTMKKVSEVLEPKIVTGYMGSKANYEDVKMQLEERFGKKVAANYNPSTNCATYNAWKKAGYTVKPGEKSVKSVTFIEKEDEATGEIKKIRRTVSLFHRCQVELAEPVTKQPV